MTTEERISSLEQRVTELEAQAHIHPPCDYHNTDRTNKTREQWNENAPDMLCKHDIQGETRNPLNDKDLANRETLQDKPKTAQNTTQTEPTMQDYQAALTTALNEKTHATLLYREAVAREAVKDKRIEKLEQAVREGIRLMETEEAISNRKYNSLRILRAALQATL